MGNTSRVQVLCTEYHRLLKESQIALTNWNKGRAEIHHSGRRGRDTDNELRMLQANFAKAWTLLQYHEQDCEVCQVFSIVEGVHSRTDAGRLHQPYN
jgi:hypothetical protein